MEILKTLAGCGVGRGSRGLGVKGAQNTIGSLLRFADGLPLYKLNFQFILYNE